MEIRPLTVFAILFVLVLLILPVFFLDMEAQPQEETPTDGVPANTPHPHKMSPEMQREYDKIKSQYGNQSQPPKDPGRANNTPPPDRPANMPPPVD